MRNFGLVDIAWQIIKSIVSKLVNNEKKFG